MTPIEMVEKFQCIGCVCGSDTQCGKFELYSEYGNLCGSHVLGTSSSIGWSFALGLPKGFNKPGYTVDRKGSRNQMMIRLWTEGTMPEWDHLNVPVWAMEQDGFLFVRTYCPRINDAYVDVIEGGKLVNVPGAINVAEFVDEID